MRLIDLIRALEAEDPELVVPYGFQNPHSWRGSYDELSFEPAENVTVGDMLAAAKGALGSTYEGWKGGMYTMNQYTEVHRARPGEMEEGIGPLLLKFILEDAKRTAERKRKADWREADVA